MLQRRCRSAVLLFTGALVGCHEHVSLKAPDSSAYEAERLQAYDALRPVSRRVRRRAVLSPDYETPSRRTVETDYLRLGNGQKIYCAEDLLPVVPEKSEVAELARASRAARRGAVLLGIAGIVTASAGLVVSVSANVGHDEQRGFNWTGYSIGAGLGSLGGALIAGYFELDRKANKQAATAYSSYEPALRDKLGLCRDNERIFACQRTPVMP